jgi:hypothetical protein
MWCSWHAPKKPNAIFLFLWLQFLKGMVCFHLVLTIKSLWLPNFRITKLGDQIFLITNYWSSQLMTEILHQIRWLKFFNCLLKMFWALFKKHLIVWLIIIQFPRCKQDKMNNLITLSKLEQIDLNNNKTHYRIMEHWMFSFQWLNMIHIYPIVHWFLYFKL